MSESRGGAERDGEDPKLCPRCQHRSPMWGLNQQSCEIKTREEIESDA